MGSRQSRGYPRVTLYHGPAVPSKKLWKLSGRCGCGGSPLLGPVPPGRRELSGSSVGRFRGPQENLTLKVPMTAREAEHFMERERERLCGHQHWGANGRCFCRSAFLGSLNGEEVGVSEQTEKKSCKNT